ncbi:unannotated protein [freshwater metagenome]|uniref:Unannotated protein n=1 Tax=freshwater metagenome TaxID=449393 RepID=A0A6J7K621_9ZZZZ|nr:hypothetical protein [Actinomycetota bacterium]MSV64363.1 hypothetical protein [Actinomycetota bacterium]MSW26407.1 hypothetical protein [Actinomycetota bacterium]MSW34558.1 hypothetical protein [Actinomycetota bacterium]MSX31266.1 hypothetical protein [Actinomycetota bacterium]
MSTSDLHSSACAEVLNTFVMLIDGEIEETTQIQNIESHLLGCTPCRTEMTHERRVHQMLQDLLARTCCETAPQDLHDAIAAMVHGPTTSIVTEFTMTEVSIQIDEFGQIEHHEITIESTQEFRLPSNE